ncbi:hypothetical protein OF83DRAFT_1177766 [Amylostereum chailletii]|nr:hypothetical protein OF83DRAFT_1177766 [Amylostereum chailletii]
MKLVRPLADARNPCYRPAESASSFLASLTRDFAGPPRSRDQYLTSFLARPPYPATSSDGGFFCWPLKNEDASFTEELLSHSESQNSSSDSSTGSQPAYIFQTESTRTSPATRVPVKRDVALLDNNNFVQGRPALELGIGLGKRSYAAISSDESTTYSDLRGSSKHRKSSQSINESSFQVDKADPLTLERIHPHADAFSSEDSELENAELFDLSLVSGDGDKSLRFLQDRLCEPDGTVSEVDRLLPLLELVYPGTRIADKMRAIPGLTFQGVADVLAEDGRFTGYILGLLRRAAVERLDLTTSLDDANGLNIGRVQDVLQVFTIPESFVSLTTLFLDYAALHDRDLLFLHRLPALKRLSMCSTGISNEAVFYTVALKASLAALVLRDNPGVTDDAAPALSLLTHLSSLSLTGTGLTMHGLRKLVPALSRLAHLDIPTACEEYLDSLHTRYLLAPAPPLVTDPDACAALALAALKRNLHAHAQCDPESDVVATGSKAQMCRRLKEVLVRRREDLAVREVVWRGREGEGEEEEGGEEEEVRVELGGEEDDGIPEDSDMDETWCV